LQPLLWYNTFSVAKSRLFLETVVGDDEPMMEANGDLSGLSLASVIFPVIGREPLALYTKEARVVGRVDLQL